MNREKNMPAEKNTASAGRAEIIVERVFGNLDLIDIYSEYVADKIKEKNAADKKTA